MGGYRLVVFDMDGVIFEHRNFWLELHMALGTYEEGVALTKKYLHKDYDRLVQEVPGRLWKGKDAAAYYALIEAMRYSPHAKETLISLREKGLRTAIITSGPKHAALRVRDECGLDYLHAHDLVIGSDGRFTGEYVYGNHDDKRAELEEFARLAGCSTREVVYVGHSHNDVGALLLAGLGVGYRPDEDVKDAADVVIEDLRSLLSLVEAQ